MITAGIDIGSMSANAAIMEFENKDDRGKVLGYSIIPTGWNSAETAKKCMDVALKVVGLKLDEIEYIVSTGYGRVIVPFANKNITEISCHAKGAHWRFPTVHTVLDMGGQDCKVITCDDTGKVTSFVMNDKCAAGAGRSMEVMAKLVGVPLESIGELSFQIVDEVANISSTCVLFARSEVLELLRDGYHKNDILAGACEALTSRVLTLLSRAKVHEDLAISGGIAKNIGITKRVEERLGLKAKISEEPQIIGAVGAALFAKDALLKQREGGK
ncbi:MAG: benzoyl-CoA reductase, bzd-type, subunit Q [Deltaproteobacteria bacterium]|nr:benzoyl-CoA reductase, bzd-type, subunit Q [Deltaproteobacteria bacterium]